MVEMGAVKRQLVVEAIEQVELRLQGWQEAVETQGKEAKGLKKQEEPMKEKNPEKVKLKPSK